MKIFGYAVFMLMFAASAFAQNGFDNPGQDLSAASTQSAFAIPSNAKSSGDLAGSSHWFWMHDAATPGSAVASSHYPVSNPAVDGQSREFYMSYSNKGGERFSLSFDHNTQVTHFVYDTYVYIDDASQMSNLELDMNQVMSDGRTVIYAFQCSGNAGAWEYSTIDNGHPRWHSTGLSCNPKSWASKKWHHVQIASHRDSNGHVTYDWVNLDGNYKTVNKGGNGAKDLHWGSGVLNLNFQIDGSDSRGSVKMYADKLIIHYW